MGIEAQAAQQCSMELMPIPEIMTFWQQAR